MVQRIPAKKVRISDLLNGKFFYGNREEMEPSYVITPYGEKVSRVNLVGTVTEKFLSEDGNYSSITLDDGTGTIRVKSFDSKLENIEIGDLVRIVGKLKEYNGELYVNFELARKVEDVNLELLHKLEILNNLMQKKKIIDEIKCMADQVDEEELKNYAQKTYSIDEETLSAVLEIKKKEIDYKPKILEIIEKLDEGKGVEVGKLFEVLNLPENIIERTIDELLNDGSLYEPIPGSLKKV